MINDIAYVNVLVYFDGIVEETKVPRMSVFELKKKTYIIIYIIHKRLNVVEIAYKNESCFVPAILRIDLYFVQPYIDYVVQNVTKRMKITKAYSSLFNVPM